jgi:hypothetical protein
MNVIQRIKAPTPKFFKILRTIGLSLVAAAGAILLPTPVTLPAAVLTIAGYVGVAGGVLTAVSQTAVDDAKVAQNNKANEPPSGK